MFLNTTRNLDFGPLVGASGWSHISLIQMCVTSICFSVCLHSNIEESALSSHWRPNLFHTRALLEVDGSLVVLSLLVGIAKILVRGDPCHERLLVVRCVNQQRHRQAAPWLAVWSMRLDLRNSRDEVADNVELVDPVVATEFALPAHQSPQHCDHVAHTKVNKSVQTTSRKNI